MEAIAAAEESLSNLMFQVVAFGDGYQLTSEDIEKLCKLSECLADIKNLFNTVNGTLCSLYELQAVVYQLRDDIDRKANCDDSPFSINETEALKQFVCYGNPGITLQGIYAKLLSIENALRRGGLL